MIDSSRITEIGELVLQCKKVIENEWESLTLIYDIGEGHTANSGFLYNNEKVRPFSAEIESQPLLLDKKITELSEEIFNKTKGKLKQLLIQIEKATGKIKIDFEFDNSERWKITPPKLKEMRELLRPHFG